jgi:GT2 family glycosyltransferase
MAIELIETERPAKPVSSQSAIVRPRRSTGVAGPATLPFVSVIVVNYNGKHFLRDCLESLADQSYPMDRREVILVDNGSTDGSGDYVRRRFPWVRLVCLPKNWGFARGNNIGFEHARGELIALLNNDAVAEPGWLAALTGALCRSPAIGAVTSKILFLHHPGVINSAGLNLYRDGRGGDRGFRQPDRGQFDEPAEVFGACGASMLVRRAMLDDVGCFDETFGMYYEDLDLAWRGRLRGWRFQYTPQAVAHHVHCGTSGEWSPFFTYHVERNRVFASIKNGPARLAVRALAVFCARAALKWLRIITFVERNAISRRQALAYIPAGFSLAWRLPEMLWKRLQIRRLRARVGDRSLAAFVYCATAVPPIGEHAEIPDRRPTDGMVQHIDS